MEAAAIATLQAPRSPFGNVYADPKLLDPASDFHIAAHSPCRDAGAASFLSPVPLETDMDGLPRLVGPRVDIGADEYAASPLYTLADGAAGLRSAGGLAPGAEYLDLSTQWPEGRKGVDVMDVVRMARTAAGLAPGG